jgi:hypothetical protein
MIALTFQDSGSKLSIPSQALATAKPALVEETQLPILIAILGSCKSEISWHFPSASGCIVFNKVRCNFIVRAYVLLYEYLLA